MFASPDDVRAVSMIPDSDARSAHSMRSAKAARRITSGIIEGPGTTAAEAFRRLSGIVLADPAPPPFIRFWLYTHPPIAERIAFAERYR